VFEDYRSRFIGWKLALASARNGQERASAEHAAWAGWEKALLKLGKTKVIFKAHAVQGNDCVGIVFRPSSLGAGKQTQKLKIKGYRLTLVVEPTSKNEKS